jgi:hypothetical protein
MIDKGKFDGNVGKKKDTYYIITNGAMILCGMLKMNC